MYNRAAHLINTQTEPLIIQLLGAILYEALPRNVAKKYDNQFMCNDVFSETV